ncbi:MAG: ankyrin repeat domain-containing protein [Leptospiraceae bacterium]|jgi:ankyrin repeat protein|nr:ankyrin repeat domain-containing protein [Leptospiraceae bacterium]MCZ8348237.1 ankyrin repeat domain-containing protein [Leptospiraceae bacterium]
MEKEELIPLIWQNNLERVNQYLKSQSPKEALPKDKYGCTALYWAIKTSSPEITRLLIEFGSSPLELNQDRNSAWSILLEKRSDELFQLCKSSLPKETFFPREKSGKNFLQKVLESNESDWFLDLLPLANYESLINLDDEGRTILHLACSLGEKDIIEQILNVAPDLLHRVASEKISPLHTLSEHDQVAICKSINQKFPDLDWNLRDNSGNTCLHYACENDATQVIEFLISKKVDCTLLNEEGDSAFVLASREKYHHSYKLIKTYLIQEILASQETNPPKSESWIVFGKGQNLFRPEDLAQLKIL